jgi:hypothetical protein
MRAQGPQQAGGGLADAAETEDRAHGAVEGKQWVRLVELAPGEHGVALGQPPGQGERHRHDVLGDRLGVGTDVAGQRHLLRDAGKVGPVGAGRQQLDEPETGHVLPGTGGQLPAQVQPDQRLGLPQDLAALARAKPGQEGNGGVPTEDLGIDPGELVIHRVADRHQPSVGHRVLLRA